MGISWFLIGNLPSPYIIRAIALVISSGLTEILVVGSYIALLPKGAIGTSTLLNIVRAYITSLLHHRCRFNSAITRSVARLSTLHSDIYCVGH